mgnify:CR=1 FL=1
MTYCQAIVVSVPFTIDSNGNATPLKVGTVQIIVRTTSSEGSVLQDEINITIQSNVVLVTPEEPMEDVKLKEMIKSALSKPLDEKKSFPDLTGDGKVTKADILKGNPNDKDSKFHHLAHSICNDLFQLSKELNK